MVMSRDGAQRALEVPSSYYASARSAGSDDRLTAATPHRGTLRPNRASMGMVREMAMTAGIPAATVAEAAAGDADALARIVGAHHDDMARIAFVICGDQDLAQDAVQSAWPLAWRKLGTLREPDRLRPWLMAIAANEARRLLRVRGRERIVEIDLADRSSTRGDPAGNPGLTDLALALRRVAPEDRALLALRYVAGFDATEIGRALGMSPSGVRSRLARLLARLREELDHD